MMGDYGRYKNLVDRTQDNWTSEQMDNFRHYKYVKKNLESHNQFKNIPLASHDKTVGNETDVQENDQKVQQKPSTVTEYDDEYRVKNIEHYNQLILELKKNELINNADKQSKARERGKTASLLRSGLLDWPEGENALPNDLGNQEIEQGAKNPEEEQNDDVPSEEEY